jgi:hypothetical protein
MYIHGSKKGLRLDVVSLAGSGQPSQRFRPALRNRAAFEIGSSDLELRFRQTRCGCANE